MSDDQRNDDDAYRDDPWRGPDPTSDPTSPIEQEPTGVMPQSEQSAAPPPPPGPYAGHDAGAPPPQGEPHQPPTDRPDYPAQQGYGAHGQGDSGQGDSGQGGYGQGSYGQGGYGSSPSPYGPSSYGQGYGPTGDYGQGGYGTGGYGYGAAPPPPPPQPGQPYGGYGAPYAPPQQNTSALILTIASGVSFVFCAGLLLIPSLVLGIIALSKNAHDPVDSRRKTKLGWILFAVGWGITIIAGIAIAVWAIAVAGNAQVQYGNSY